MRAAQRRYALALAARNTALARKDWDALSYAEQALKAAQKALTERYAALAPLTPIERKIIARHPQMAVRRAMSFRTTSEIGVARV